MNAILIVDDEPAIRESLAFALRRDGFAIAEAASLREAQARTDGADLVILDLVLPDGNGLDFLRALRSKSDVASATGERNRLTVTDRRAEATPWPLTSRT